MGKWSLHTRVGAVALVVMGVAWGCGLDETYTGLGEGALPGDPLRPNAPLVIVDCGCTSGGGQPADGQGADYGQLAVEDLTGAGYRFDSLVLTAPLTGVIGDGVNDYFAEQIDAELMNVLLEVQADDRVSGDLDMVIGSGEAVDGGYQLGGEPSELACALTGRYFDTVEPSSLTFPNDLLDPPELPIKFLRLSGWFAADGSQIEDGVLDGALTEEDAGEITVFGSDFATLLGNMGIEMDLDTDDDGTNDAWRFVGTFAASQVDLLEDGS